MMLSKYFSINELKCKGLDCCGGVYAIHPTLLEKLDALREVAKSPLFISSGFRCFTHNQRIQGAQKSQHCQGKGVDIYSKDLSIDDLLALIKRIGFNGVGVYDSWIHVDIRDGDKASWDARTCKKYER